MPGAKQKCCPFLFFNALRAQETERGLDHHGSAGVKQSKQFHTSTSGPLRRRSAKQPQHLPPEYLTPYKCRWLAAQAGLSGRVVMMGCQAGLSKPVYGCLAGWLAWPAGWPAWPGLPPCPPSPPDATTGATGLSELGRRLDRKEAPATPQKAAPKANDRSSRLGRRLGRLLAPATGASNRRSLRPNSDFAGCAGCEF